MQSTNGSYSEWRSDTAALSMPWSDLEVYTICQGETSRMMLLGHFVVLLFQNTVLHSIHMRTQDSFWMTSFRQLWHRSSCSSFILKTTTFNMAGHQGDCPLAMNGILPTWSSLSASYIILCSRTTRLYCLPFTTLPTDPSAIISNSIATSRKPASPNLLPINCKWCVRH